MSETVTVESFELNESDIAPDISASKDQAPGKLCEKLACSNTVTKPARGRTPKFCDEHKQVGGGSSRSATSGKSWGAAKEVESLLLDYVGFVSTGLMFVNKEDAIIVSERAPKVVTELVELAKTDKYLQRYLMWIATPGKYGPLTIAVGSLVLPLMANHNMLPKFSIPEGGD